MGCQNSKRKETPSDSDCRPSQGNVTKKARRIVQEMWLDIKPNAKKFGVPLFLRMFDEKPEVQDLFYHFKNIEDEDELVKSLEELDHVARVMNALGSCIEILGHMNQFEDTVQRLGSIHIGIGVREEHLSVFRKILIEHLAEQYQSSWTIGKEEAWAEVIDLIAVNFLIGLRGAKDGNGHN